MADEKCCCNCLHCARWHTSKGVECHCDLTDRYLGYLDVMDTDNNCCRWEKETKWEIEAKHDIEIYNQALNDFAEKLCNELEKHSVSARPVGWVNSAEILTLDNVIDIIFDVTEQLKEKGVEE